MPDRDAARRPQRRSLPGALLKRVREHEELTQAELGDVFEISEQTIYRYERLGAARLVRFALIGWLVTRGKPFGILWPEH